jgi:hypothetical protein
MLARAAALLAVASLAASAVGAAHGTVLRSGLWGTVTRGPITPVCRAGEPCTAPAAGAVLRFFRGAREAGRVRVAADGSYRIRLAAGDYAVRGPQRRLEPLFVHVRARRMARVDFSIDTGIR